MFVARHECITTPILLAPFSFSFLEEVNLHVRVHFLLQRRDPSRLNNKRTSVSVLSHTIIEKRKKETEKKTLTVVRSSTGSPKRTKLSFRFAIGSSVYSLPVCVCVCKILLFSFLLNPFFLFHSFVLSLFLFLPPVFLSRPRVCA